MKDIGEEILSKTQILAADWPVDLAKDLGLDLGLDLEIRREINWETLRSTLVSDGWTAIECPRYDVEPPGKILTWCVDTLQGKIKWFGKEWLFERQEDAIMFSLTWL